jgi:hypothetical protein
MPQVFKALATINAWALFIISWIALLSGYARMIGAYAGVDMTPAGAPSYDVALMFGFAGLVLSVVVMKLRKLLE